MTDGNMDELVKRLRDVGEYMSARDHHNSAKTCNQAADALSRQSVDEVSFDDWFAAQARKDQQAWMSPSYYMRIAWNALKPSQPLPDNAGVSDREVEAAASALASLPIRDESARGSELDVLRLREAARAALLAARKAGT